MNKLYKQIISVILTLVLIINILPAYAISLEQADDTIAISETQEEATLSADPAYQRLDTAQITEEDTSKRSEYSKEFVLNNGLRMAALYADPVHYKENGQWEEIDNTLKASGDTFTNTAGVWTVSFPRNMSKSNAVTITKDGYTLSFFMSGQLYNSGNLVARTAESLSIQSAQTATAQKQEIDHSAIKADMEHPEIFPDKLQSRLAYNEVFNDTDIIYDLSANQVKESIVMSAYNAKLQGYRYTLQTGQLRPALTDSGEIHLYDAQGQSIIMTMPAPFLVDDAGVYCYDVEVSLTGGNGTYTLTYLLPQQWLASADRQWPLILDPAVSADTTRSNIRDVSVYERNAPGGNTSGVLDVGHNTDYGKMRAFLKYDLLPALTSADVVIDAELTLIKPNNHNKVNAIEIHKVLDMWKSESLTWSNQPDFNPTVEDHAIVQNAGVYRWRITDVVRGWYESENTGLMLKAPDWVENTTSKDSYRKQFYSSDYNATYRPVLTIVYRNNNGLESYWDYTASSAGRAGTGYINNYTGNLVWVHGDMGYGGNLMPVSINHIYNANDIPRPDENGVLRDPCNFGMGYAWRTNYNQTVNSCTLPQTVNGVTNNVTYYVWTDSDGTKHYFYETENDTYQDEDGLDLTLKLNDRGFDYTITDKYGNASCFDQEGRLRELWNNQPEPSCIAIEYSSSTSTRISTITDGVGREYRFTYSSGFLSRLSYYGTGNTELGYLTYSYSNGCLSGVTYQDGESVSYTYNADCLLTSAKDIDGYQLTYTYHPVSDNWQPYRIKTVSETDGAAEGGMLTITYDHNQTTFTDYEGHTQIAQFNNWGNTVSIQDGEGRAQFAQYAHEQSTNGKGNQLTMASKLQNTVGNMLKDSSFENGTLWGTVNGVSQSIVTANAYSGAKALKFTNNISTIYGGVSSGSFTAKSGKSYTFSAYVKTDSTAQAYLAIFAGENGVFSEILPSGSDWTRLEVTYTNSTNADVSISLRIFSATAGSVYVDCVQLEQAESASRYNIIENGDFRHGTYNWIMSEKCDANETTVTDSAAAPELNSTVFQIVGDPRNKLRIRQEVPVSGGEDDTFVLAGWAKGYGVPLTEYTSDKRTFTLRGTFMNTDGTTDEFNFNFNPLVSNWQYASGVMVAKKAFSGIKIQVLYDYGANTIVFDGIQLYKEEYGESYGYDTNGNVTSVKDIQGQITEYEYAEENNVDLYQIIQDNKAKVTYEYDDNNNHNVETATTEEGLVYEFGYDSWGNNTSVSIANGETKITSTADYTDDGNRLEWTEDALGKKTYYGYNADTNLLEWVQAPRDSEATRTEYTYDEMYRLASASATTNLGYNLLVNYTYDEDLLTEISTQSTTYTFAYGDFALRSSIKIGSRTLATYTYEKQKNRLSELVYGNQDVVQYTYDTYGRLLSQTYEDNDTVTYRYDNSGALAAVQDSASGLTTRYYYDFTDRMMKYTETGTDFSHSVGYTYDKLNNLTGLKETINGTASTTTYTYDDDNRVKTVTNGNVTETYSYDAYGRLLRQTTKQGDTTVTYLNYAYKTNSDGSPTDRVGRIAIYSNGYNVAYTYNYDSNGNITHISDGTNQITYVYDTQNQLLRENNPYVDRSYRYYYDNAGNITRRQEYAYTTGTLTELLDTVNYTYGDADWGDLLTAYDGQTITYDGIGNPLSDGFWTYTWEHGRQLSTIGFTGNSATFTYNADGLRIAKNFNNHRTVKYVYNGSQVTQVNVTDTDDESVSYTLRIGYDALGSPLTVNFNGTTYFYATNVQGDVIAILDAEGNAVVTYSYDAWGNPTGGTRSDTDPNANALYQYNPLRYRGYVYDFETGLYYLQSRYYNPQTGRFLNADSYASTGQGILGNNTFTYCNNSPTTNYDSCGQWTMGISIGAALEFMFGVSVSIGIYWDDNYNFEAQWSYSVPFVNNTSTIGTVAAGVGLTFQYTNKDTVRDLYGPTTTYGGSAGGDYFYVGGDLLTTDDVSNPDMRNDGFQITGGVGVGLDFHFANTMTQRVGKYIPPVHTVRESPFGESDQPSMPNYLHDGSFMPCQCILCKFNIRH